MGFSFGGNYMKLVDIQKLMNNALAGETLTLKEMLPHLDFAIDEINDTLNSIYPTFSELLAEEPEATEYSFFPDRYIRRTVISGAAWNYYVVDEEGLQTSIQYQADFEKGKFVMQRDMLYNIPEQFQASVHRGFVVGDSDNDTVGERGLEVDLDF